MPDFDPQIIYVDNTFQVSDMLYSAYRMAQALKNPGTGISPSESKEGLDILNAMMDGWKIENLLIPYTRRTVQDVLTGQKVYSVGPGQDFDLERPEKINRAGFLVPSTGSSTAEIPMAIISTYEEYASLVLKDVQSTIPLALYYQNSVPYGAATLWPVPNVDSEIAIYTAQLPSEFSTVEDDVQLPKGYREMLQYNLAVRVHHRYPDKTMDPEVSNQASITKEKVKANQLTGLFIGSDPATMQEDPGGRWYGGLPKAWTPY